MKNCFYSENIQYDLPVLLDELGFSNVQVDALTLPIVPDYCRNINEQQKAILESNKIEEIENIDSGEPFPSPDSDPKAALYSERYEIRAASPHSLGCGTKGKKMRNIFRKIIGHMVVFPFVVSCEFLSLFLGQEKAIEVVGPRLTKSAKRSLRFWVPKIENAKDFDSFPAKMKKNFCLWAPFYNIEISEESSDVFKLHVSNCPFCEALNHIGMSKLSPYVCEGDWAIARDNADKWKFERNHQIGTGDNYCDHTYKRI